jgi:two-component system nitrogen regulation response regulator GlnG/two-component system response regulator HydG
VDDLRAAVASLRPDLPVVTTVFRPHPAEPVAGERVAFFTTAPAVVHPALRASLETDHGADVVAVSGSLSDRAADVPLLARHLLARAAADNEEVRRRFCELRGGAVEPRVDPALVDRLLRHSFRTNTRELAQILWQALAESRGDTVELTAGVAQRLAEAAPSRTAAGELDRAQIEVALAAAGGNVTRAARSLGLKNRFVLYRLMKKIGVDGSVAGTEEDAAE